MYIGGHGSRPRSSGGSRRESSSPYSRRRQPAFRSGWIRRSTSACAGRRRTGRPVTGRRSKGKPTSSVTIELRARIREMEGRLYSRRSECLVSEGKSPSRRPVSSRPRGQQPGSRGRWSQQPGGARSPRGSGGAAPRAAEVSPLRTTPGSVSGDRRGPGGGDRDPSLASGDPT